MGDSLAPDTFALLVLTCGLGGALVVLALRAKSLEARRSRRRCAACGRLLEGTHPCRCRR